MYITPSKSPKKALWISVVSVVVILLGVGVIAIFNKPKLMTVAELKQNKLSLNGAHVRIIGYYVDGGADGFILSDQTFADHTQTTARIVENSVSSNPLPLDPQSVVARPAPPDCTYSDKLDVEGKYDAVQDVLYIDKAEKIGHVSPFLDQQK